MRDFLLSSPCRALKQYSLILSRARKYLRTCFKTAMPIVECFFLLLRGIAKVRADT